MQYRDFGNTGIKISALGFGAMRLPTKEDGKVDVDNAIKVIHRAFELGVNYIDTAHGYHRGESEVVVGEAVRSWNGRVHVSTKNPCREPSGDAWREMLDISYKRLGLEQIDFLHFHGLRWESFTNIMKVPNGPLEAALKARDEGLFKYLSFSCHDKPENMKKLIDTGLFATMTVQYNILDQANTEMIAYAREKGMGVVIMGPVGGGRLAAPSDRVESLVPGAKSNPEIAFRFVLANPNVSTAISGMNTIAMVEENAATASRSETLSAEEKERIAASLQEVKKLTDLYCTGCGYCVPCPNQVNIPRNFMLMNHYRVWGLKDYARNMYAGLGDSERKSGMGKKASECVECGECEPKCPQNIPIIEQLKEVAATLGSDDSSGKS